MNKKFKKSDYLKKSDDWIHLRHIFHLRILHRIHMPAHLHIYNGEDRLWCHKRQHYLQYNGHLLNKSRMVHILRQHKPEKDRMAPLHCIYNAVDQECRHIR